MKIKNVSLLKVEIPMIHSFTTGFGTVTSRPTVIVKATTEDGIIGYGESSALPFPNYKPDTTDTCMLALKDYIAPLVLNKEFEGVEQFTQLYNAVKGHNFAKTGIETAVWMIMAVKENKSLKELLGGTRDKIEVGESIGIKDTVEQTLEEIELRLHEGFKRIKVKIQPGWDIELIDTIRKKWPDISLMVDGNSSYTLANKEVFKQLDRFKLLMIEQPLADDDIVDHSILQKEIKTPICLDESILSAEDARRAIYLKACKIINIKPGRVGGLLESKKIHDYCKAHNVGVWCGGLLETGIGRAFNIATASLENYIYPADMSPANFYYKDDLVKDSFVVDKTGNIAVSNKPGLGYEIDEKKIEQYTVEKVEL